MAQVSHHRKPEYSWLSYQRRKVKDFFIKFKKKLHFADFFTEQTLDFVLQRLLCRLAEMNLDNIGGLVDGLADAGRRVGFGNGLLIGCVVHQVPPVKMNG